MKNKCWATCTMEHERDWWDCGGGKSTRLFLLFAGLLLLILFAFYWPWICGAQSFYLSDLTYYFEPLVKYISFRLRQGQLPLWNPWCFCGMSQIAIPSPGVFYPPNWIWVFLSFSSGLAVSMIIHQWVAGIGAFLLVSELGWGTPAAIVAGLITALCGYMFSLQANFTLVDSAAWLPLCLWSLYKVEKTAHPVFKSFCVTFAGLCVALTLLAGRPEVSAPVMMLVAGYVIISSFYTAGEKSFFSVLSLRCGAIIFGVLLAMPGILPTLEWAALSTRAHGLSNQDIFTWSANWHDFLSMVLAQPLGDLYARGAPFLSVATPRANYIPFIGSCYAGPAAVTLAIWGLFDRRWKLQPYALAILVAGVIMSAGSYTPIAPAVTNFVHCIAVFRYPEKLLVFVLFSIAFLAARGMYLVSKNEIGVLPLRSTVAMWLVWLMVMSAFIVSPISNFLAAAIMSWHGSGASQSALSRALVLIGQDGITAGLTGLFVCAAMQLRQLRKLPAGILTVIIPVTVSTCLVNAACITSRHGTEPDFFKHKAFLETQLRSLGLNRSSRVLSLFFDPLTYPNDFLGFSGEDATARFYQYGRQLLLPNTNMDAQVAASYGYEASQTAQYRKLFMDVYTQSHACAATQNTGTNNSTRTVNVSNSTRPPSNSTRSPGNSTLHATPSCNYDDRRLSQFCRLSSTQFAVSQLYKYGGSSQKNIILPLLDTKYFKVTYENKPLNVRIYRVFNPLPRIYFADFGLNSSSANTLQASSSASALTPISMPAPAVTPSSTSLLDCMHLQLCTAGKIVIISNQPEELVLRTTTDSQHMLVVSDQYYPGWKATIDGAPITICRVNNVFRGVLTPPGTYLIRFSYQPESLYWGLILAAIGVGIWSVIMVAIFRQSDS